MSGQFVFENGGTINDRPSPAGNLEFVSRGTIVEVTGKTGDWYRVVLPNGQVGFTLARGLTPVGGEAEAPTPIARQDPEELVIAAVNLDWFIQSDT